MLRGEGNASPFLIRGGRIVDPEDGYDAIGDLLIEDGRVVARESRIDACPPATEVADAIGFVVCPGFLDLHTHLRFPGFTAKETIISGTAAAAAGGFTTVCAMANTRPVVDSVEVLRHVLETVARDSMVCVEQFASVTCGLEGLRLTDFDALVEAGAVAFSDDGKPIVDEDMMRLALISGRRVGRPISVHEEDPAIVRGGVANAGESARRLGLAEWPCSGEAQMVERDIRLAHETGGHLHVAHVSCADTVPLIRNAKAQGIRVTAEVTPHHLRLTDGLLEGDGDLDLPPAHPRTKVNPPLRSGRDVEALVNALVDGTIDAVATDHAPHTADDKDRAFCDAAFGISGIETALPLLLELVRANRISLPGLIRRLTVGPASVLGRNVSLRVGARADVCVFDPEEEWVVTADALKSKGKNTPLLNAGMRGRVKYTFVGGHLVHRS